MKQSGRVIATLIVATLTVPAYAQLTLVNEPQAVSAQASQFDRYGKYDANLYTGRLTVRIPVYEYKDADFTLSVTLDYSSSGLRPNDPASEVGLGWSLGCGGVITREVKGAPDEERGRLTGYQGETEVSHDFEPFDSLPFSSHATWENSPEFEVFTGDGTPGVEPKCYYSVTGHCYDGSPDIYHFSFLGHSGTFVRGLDGKFRVFNTGRANGEYKVEKSNRPMGDGSLSGYSEIVITTGDGYRYTFGSLESKSDYNDRLYPEDAPKEGDYTGVESITSWKLRRVEAPNGRSMTFIYGGHGEGARQIYSYRPAIWQKVSSSSYTANYTSVRSAVTTSPLAAVEVGGVAVVTFDYGDRPLSSLQSYLTAEGEQPVPLDHTAMLLKVINHGRSATHLTHSFNPSGNHHPFLAEVHTDGIGSYRMEYAGRESVEFPSFGTVATDHWGYFNKTTPSVYRCHRVTMSQISSLSGLSETLTDFKSPNAVTVRYGQLERLEYPTGGYTAFEYEMNSYGSAVRKSASKNYSVDEVTESGSGGGLRVRRVENHDRDGSVTDWTEYAYVSALGGGATSGRLLSYPRYQVAYGGTCWVVPFVQWYGTTGGVFAYDRVPVEYGRVEERRSDNSRTVHRFATWAEVPDVYTHDYEEGYRETQNGGEHVIYPSVVTNATSVHNLLEAPGSLQAQRGRPVQRQYYAAGGTSPLKEERMTYNTAAKTLSFLPEYTNVGDAIGIGRRYTDDYDLTEVESREYHGTGTVTGTVSYTYNALGQKTGETVLESDGRLRRTTYTYVTDKPESERSAAERQMVTDNVLGYPLEVIEETRDGQAPWVRTGGDRYTFSAVTCGSRRCFRVTRHEKYDLGGTYYTFAEYRYDNLGNMTERKDADGECTSYLWGTEGNGVAVTAVGASNAQVKGCLGEGIFDSRVSDGEVIAKAASLRGALEGAGVSAVRYLKYGVPRETVDASGRSVTYGYDINDRLVSVKEENTRVISTTDYSTVTK